MEAKSFVLKMKVSLKTNEMETLPVSINLFWLLLPVIESPLTE